MKLLAAGCIGVCCAFVAASLAGHTPMSGPSRLGVLATRRARLTLWLQQAGVLVSPSQFVVGSAFAGLLALAVVTSLTGSMFVACVPALAIASCPILFFGQRRKTRLRAVHAAWPDGLRDILASISSGHSLTQALNALAKSGPPPLREALTRFPDLARVLGTTAALEVAKADLADPTSDRILEVLILAHERGGAIVRSILADLIDATTKDLKLLDELETEGLEMRINARAVVVLPWFVLVALTARPGPFREFYRSGGGVTTLMIGAVLSLVGVMLLHRLGNQPDEVRVVGNRDAR